MRKDGAPSLPRRKELHALTTWHAPRTAAWTRRPPLHKAGTNSLFGVFLTVIETSHFGAVSAFRHVAPAAAVVFALVQKQPFTSVRRAGAHERELIRSQQLRCGACDGPQ